MKLVVVVLMFLMDFDWKEIFLMNILGVRYLGMMVFFVGRMDGI